MAKVDFGTANETLRKLCGNGLLYSVPMFQRDYSWTYDEWDDLWNDILGLFSDTGEDFHYMGYLVLQSEDAKSFSIIDGQQRMTTVSIIILATIQYLEKLSKEGVDSENNNKRAEQFRNTYIGYMDPVSLVPQSKLRLNKNNDDFYQTYLVPLQKMPQRGLKQSEKLLKKSFNWFSQKIADYFANNKDGAECARFIDGLADKIVFTVISVNDELNAFKVFETLNARGVKLSSTDLLKNYLFSIVHSNGSHETEIMQLEKMWTGVSSRLEGEDLPTFMRYYWNSFNKFARKNELFKAVRSNIKEKSEVFDFVRKLGEYADIYIALKRPEDELWDNEQSKYLKELKIFNVKQPIGLLMVSQAKLPKEIFTKILKTVSIISFRYNAIGGLNPNEMEKVYNNSAITVSSDQVNTSQDILESLKPLYISDDAFLPAFENAYIRTFSSKNNALIRYIFGKIESHLTGGEINIEGDKFSIEHIYPENPNDEWVADFDEQYLYRLGNYALMEKTLNRDAGNNAFKIKKAYYE
ncbi:MAG: DUF262 domain-containing protein, partial [Nitrospinae bacterium]|nr:DUF262 domain-containing protein [Nitrospinota bacterium]